MFATLIRAAAPLSLTIAACAAPAQTAIPITAADLMRHMEPLASDRFEGRAPATRGEQLTTAYIVEQFQARGLQPAGEGGTWFQPVRLVERRAGRHSVTWTANGRPVTFANDEIMLSGRDAQQRVANAPVIFAGHGARMPDRGIDQLAGVDVRGAVVLIMLEGPQVEGFPSLAARRAAVSAAGAVAVIAIVGENVPWATVRQMMAGQRATQLDNAGTPEITGAMPLAAAQRLATAAGSDITRLLNDQPGSSFRAVPLNLRASMEVETAVNRYTTNNVIGRLRGSGSTNESVLFLSHWDHLGICRPEGEADRICNGAVDNASGIASLIEIAGRLGQGTRPVRDILFLATTAEESGLLGAEYFATHPVVPAQSIVAAINMDTVAIHRAGLPIATIGRGIAPSLDRVVDAVAGELGRQIDTDDEANVMVQRQDGWKLNQAGIPTIMISGSFSDMSVLTGFLESSYHKPNDQLGGAIEMGGAVEDANLLVAIGRRIADPSVYQRRAPEAAEAE